MKNKAVKVGDKEIFVVERRIKELKELFKDFSESFKGFLETDLKDKNTDDIVDIIVNEMENKITLIFPQLTTEDIDNAYPSEISALVEAFVDVNFTGAKKVISQVMRLA
ncbi:hypothetical protein SDC9_72737 [bioreactor metagenome]|uniref:Uncharacterized protein n=1 Tax=bioreactor metagenome TaxID=1076179 RepID=A0A644YCE9_9ZZZZ